MGWVRKFVPALVAAVLICGLPAAACCMQVEFNAHSLMVTDADLETLPAATTAAAADADATGDAAQAGDAADSEPDAISNANAILAEDAKLVDGGFRTSETMETSATEAEASPSASPSATSDDGQAATLADAAAASADADATDADADADATDADAASASAAEALASALGSADLAELTAEQGDYKYLSEYTPIVNQIGWSTRKDDVNYDGNNISLIVNGERKYFYKGVSAHASSTLVYDLGENCPYDTFDAYMGVDASRGTNGWAKMTAYTSADNETWTQVGSEFLGRGTTEAVHIHISLEGVRYLKFVGDPQGQNASDHTCLGGAVLYKGTYEPSEAAPVIKTVDALTQELAAYTDEQILATRGASTAENPDTPYMNMLRRSLVEKAGYDNLNHGFFDCSARTVRTTMMQWLWNDEQALEDFVTGGTPNSGGYVKSLIVLTNLYAAYGADLASTEALFTANPDGPAQDRGDLYRIMMVAIALTHDNGPYMWQASSYASDPLERYAAYKRTYADNIMRNDVFENLTVEEMRWVMGGRIWNDEVYWLNRYAYNARPTAGYPLVYSPHYFLRYGKDWDWNAKGLFNEANYPTYDAKYSLTKYGVTPVSSTTKLSKMWMIFEGSQICWGISYSGTSFANSFGVPSKYVRQPGHAAFFVYNRNSEGKATWGIDNNISGWTQTWVNEDTVGNGNARMMCDWGTRGTSNVSSMNSTYIQLCSTSQDNVDAYERAEALLSLESRCTTSEEKIALYQDVLEIMPYHWDAWRKLCALYTSEKSVEEIAELAEQLTDSMWYFPLPMHDLMNTLYSSAKTKAAAAKTAAEALPETTDEEIAAKQAALDAAAKMAENVAFVALCESQALDRGTQANTKGTAAYEKAKAVIAQLDVCSTMANYLKGSLSTSLASFSFDGDNAGKVVFGSAYEGVRYRISIDGGATWNAAGESAGITTKDNMSFQLSSEQLAAITEDKDILIWLEGWTSDLDGNAPDPEKAFRIDILSGGTLNGTTEPNDYENRFMSVQANAEYCRASADDPTQPSGNWEDLTTATDFTGYAGKVFVRIKAYGCHVAGVCDTSKNFYTFSNKYTYEEDPTHVYVPISRLTYDSCSSEETSRASDQAAHVVDGTLSTRWHTLWDGSDSEKWVTIKLDEPTYISQVNYTPVSGGGNGTMYACTVYVSSDNLTWVKAGAGSGWGNNDTVKQVVFDHSVYGQYVKIQATSTVGNYASARRFDIFEDQQIASRKMTGFRVTAPDKTDYVEGEKLDLSGMQVFFTYADSKGEVEMPYTHLSASEEYLYGAGAHTIYLSCGSFVPQAITVNVAARTTTPTSISIAAPADKLVYYEGDELNTEGLRVQAVHDDITVLLTKDEYTAHADLSEPGTKTVTISYGGCTTTYDVEVKAAPVSLKILSKPTKSTYTLGELLETDGLTVNAVYSDGSELALEAADYLLIGSEEFAETAGDIELTVALAGRESVCAPFVVTVYPYFTRDGINYSLVTQRNEATGADELCIFVTGFSSGVEFIRIPAAIRIGSHTYPVRGVEGGAMTNVTGVKEIALPGSITTIESGAFTGSETIKNIYLTEHESFDTLDAAKDAFDPDTNLVLYAGSEGLTKELQEQDFAKEMAVKDVTEDVASLKLSGSHPVKFSRGDEFTSEGLQVTGVLKDAEGQPTENEIALAPSAYTVSGPSAEDMNTAGEKTVTVTFVKKPQITAAYTVNVAQVTLRITENPKSAVYYRGESGEQIAALTVAAASDRAGDVLLYQWYSAGAGPNGEDVALEGETSKSYRPSQTGTYYAVVGVQGQEGLTAQSMMADVGIGDYTAIVGDAGYNSLNAAVAAASGQTVKLLKDVTITSGINVSHSFTLDGLDPDTGETHSITRGSGFTGAFVTVSGSASVTLSHVVLDGGAIWEKDKSKAKWYYDVIERDTGNTGISAQAPLLAATSTAKLYLNEGTVLQNNANAYSGGAPGTNTAGAIRANDYAAIYLDGAQILDCYSYWFGAAIYHRDHTSLTISGNSKIHGCSGTDTKSTSAICADNYSTLTINGGEFCHNMGYYKGALIWAGSGAVNINGGNIHDNGFFKSTGGMGTMLYLSGTAKVSVKDYTALQDIYLASGSQVISVTGDLTGKAAGSLAVRSVSAAAACVQASSDALLHAAQDVTTINGKETVISGGKLAPAGEGGLAVAATIERNGNTAQFATLADAISWAADGEDIVLQADASLSGAITLTKALSIVLNGHTVEGADYLSAAAGSGLAKKSTATALEIVRAELKFSAASLALQDDLRIRYKVDKGLLDTYTDLTVTFAVDGETDEQGAQVVRTVTDYRVQGDKLVFVCNKLAPNRMGNTVVAQLFATSGGVVYHSAPVSYSVTTYCKNILAKYNAADYAGAQYDTLRTMLVDLLYYGEAAQTYTAYRTESPVTSILTDEQRAWRTTSDRAYVNVLNKEYAKADSPTVAWKGASLRLESNIAMRLLFTTDAGVDGLTFKAEIKPDPNDETTWETWTLDAGDVESATVGTEAGYALVFSGLNASQLSEPVYITAYNGDVQVSDTVRYSVESYAADVVAGKVSSEKPEELLALVKAMMRYGDAAKLYKSSWQ